MEFLEVSKHVTPNHLKGENKSYNYYLWKNDASTVHEWMDRWVNNNPMVHMGGKVHQFLDVAKKNNQYSGAYKFQNKIY